MSVFSAFSKIAPPPSYMSMPGVGVDISDASMKYVSFHPSLRTDRFRIMDKWGDIDIPNGVLDRGEIVDPKTMVSVLKEFKEQTKAEYIRVSLPEERAYIFETKIKADVPVDEIKNMLEFKLEENVPISARDAIFDYDVISNEIGRSVDVVVAAYQRETILKYYDACQEADLTPLSFEVEAQAMARAVVPQDDNNEVVMLVDFGKTRTGVGIVNKGRLLYTSTVDVGGAVLSRSLRKVLGENVSEKEITKIKNDYGLVGDIDDERIYDSLIQAVSIIKDEIILRMQYWHQKTDGIDERRIKKIIMCGGSVNLRGLPEYMTEMLGVPCLRANVWENAFDKSLVIPPIEKRFSYGYATAIGLALKSTI